MYTCERKAEGDLTTEEKPMRPQRRGRDGRAAGMSQEMTAATRTGGSN